MRRLRPIAEWHGQRLLRRHFGPAVMARLHEAIRSSERGHLGEIVVAVEAAAPPHIRDSRERALEVFGRLRVWDTAQATGVLLYLLLADHRIEIVADRGVTARIDDAVWPRICAVLRERFQAGRYEEGVLEALAAIEAELLRAWPAPTGETNAEELPDGPVIL
ncbi:TPM domain-containing protein [Inquilinus limosus]|uniref:TPM domain-containing protein n=1 Tax=Inquilinus limosus TaxID=171674 RepID=UPI0006877F37|nr:TPM domain-containing protein [Inquilinus limosus]